MTRQEIEKKRFWFRVRVLTVLALIVLGGRWAFKGIQSMLSEDGQVPAVAEPPMAEEAQPVVETPTVEAALPFEEVPYYTSENAERYEAYATRYPEYDDARVVREVNMKLDYAFYSDDAIEPAAQMNTLMVLCNKFNQIPADYKIEQLTDVPASYHLNDSKTYRLDQRALDAFVEMHSAAKAEGVSLTIVSAYRTHDFQKRLYDNYVARSGKSEADRFSARPGHSEHETGLAIDLNQIAERFEDTEAFRWLSDNAHTYGYILRYPKGLEGETGYMYEPWHYRFVGREVAEFIKTEDITFDAYHAMYLVNPSK
ncbi:M15 family metallopeptidase [Fusibacter sp. JL298sf-3]